MMPSSVRKLRSLFLRSESSAMRVASQNDALSLKFLEPATLRGYAHQWPIVPRKVGQTIAFRGLSRLGNTPLLDRRQNPIVCPTPDSDSLRKSGAAVEFFL